ncbi:MAG: histidinol-phosphatase [Alphaproteobacteria bacterium]
MPNPCPAEFVSFAVRLAEAAGEAIRPHFRTPMAIDTKSDASPVTIADRNAEAAMRALIERAYPTHGIWGEEFGVVRRDAEFVWVLDPIDGTKAFISGLPIFGTLIALTRSGKPILGIIDQPISRERWLGAVGMPTTFNGTPCRTRACPSTADATMFTTAHDMFDAAARSRYERLRKAPRLVRNGGDCYAAGLLASGFVDLWVEGSLKPYDYLAIVPIVEGAGGTITDWAGAALGFDSDGLVCAAGDARTHTEALRLLAA